MANERARKGGQRGVNGEWYEGGKFLPSTQQPKGATVRRSTGTGRVQIAPGVWEVPPEGRRAIYPRIDVFIDGHHLYETGLVRIHERFTADHPAVQTYSDGLDVLRDLADRYNAGERWIDASS